MNLGTLLEDYGLSNPDEIDSINLFTAFLKNLPGLSKVQSAGHFTASAWIINYDRSQVLLTHHAKLNQWFQLGGHVEKGEDILTAALREAREESGLMGLQIGDRRIFDIDAHLIPANTKEAEHFHFDIRFLLQADSEDPLKMSSESHNLRWVTPQEALRLNHSESIVRMISKMACLEPSVFGEIQPDVIYTERQGAYGLLMNGRNELALVRVPNPQELFLPGGGIEKGETHALCLEREFVEETGLQVRIKDFLGTSVQYIYAHRVQVHYKIIGHMYFCELIGQGKGKIEEDHELVWVPLERAKETMAMDNQKWAVGKIFIQSSQY